MLIIEYVFYQQTISSTLAVLLGVERFDLVANKGPDCLH